MISAGDFRNGVTIEFEGNIYQIIEFQHVKPGKGAAFVRTKLRISSVVVLLRRHSVQQRNALQHTLTVRICSIFMQMMISIISWMLRHMTRLTYQRMRLAMLSSL